MSQPINSVHCSEIVSTTDDGLHAAWQANRENLFQSSDKPPVKFKPELTPEDVKLVNEMGRFTPDQLHEFIKSLQNSAYLIGLDEGQFY